MSATVSQTAAPTMLVLPLDKPFCFLTEPSITFRSCSSASSSDDGYEDDDGGFHAPFTTSPLDECRGPMAKTAEASRGVLLHATTSFAFKKKATTAARRRKHAKATTLRAGH
jgi:hypothetical protein